MIRKSCFCCRVSWFLLCTACEPIINSISSIFSVSINIRVLVLRTIFHVARLSADQRAIQKKDECCFSIFYKKQLHKGELTGQSKWGQRCMGSWIAVLYWIWIEIALNLNNWIQPTGNDSRLLSKIHLLSLQTSHPTLSLLLTISYG